MKLCKERQALWERYIADLRAYGASVAKMESAFNLPDFFEAFAKAEEQREVFLDARAALDEHTAGHGCNVTADCARMTKTRKCRGRTRPAASRRKRTHWAVA
jgi:hypothetical protein